MRRILICAVLACLLVPAAAQASGRDVVRDCTDDEVISGHYSAKEYADAIKQLGGDSDQYTNCRDVIRRAQLAAAGGKAKEKKKSSSPKQAKSAGTQRKKPPAAPQPAEQQPAPAPADQPATPAEANQLDQARQAPRPALNVAAVGVRPDGEADAGVPTPVVVLLVGLGLAALIVTGLRLRSLGGRR